MFDSYNLNGGTGMIHISQAVLTLRPGASFTIDGEQKYENIIWNSKDLEKPSKIEVLNELNRLQEEYDFKEYQRLRSKEYPPVTDYLDAVVKGDLAQQQAYIDACLAVKAKYPKPEGA
jgi:hypothetical protein